MQKCPEEAAFRRSALFYSTLHGARDQVRAATCWSNGSRIVQLRMRKSRIENIANKKDLMRNAGIALPSKLHDWQTASGHQR